MTERRNAWAHGRCVARQRALQARIDAALALIAKALESGPFLDPDETRALLAVLQGDQPGEPWTPSVGERVTGVETQNVGQPVVTGYFHSSGADGLSWLKVHADDPETAQRFLVGTATLKPASVEPRPRCCIGPFADGTHAPGCLDACQDCGGDEAGPHRCQCRDVEPECTCTPSRCDYDGYSLDGPACLPCGQRPQGAPCLAVAEPTGEVDRG
ncbi:hypothetical protein ACWEF6_02830 [Amycolatopsis sp. NPDC004772]